MPSSAHEIKDCIKAKLDDGFEKFIIFPYGDVGMQVKYILNTAFDIQESYLLDSHLAKYNPKIKTPDFLETLDCKDYCLIFATTNLDNYYLITTIQRYFPDRNIAILASARHFIEKLSAHHFSIKPPIGKYSYGPLCDNPPMDIIESIGAFCSFAPGATVVPNHKIRSLTTHPIIYAGSYYEGAPWAFPGVQPIHEKGKVHGLSTIGNDVWLGQNVIITNYANIGNGVIAAAGAVITKDVPDYAVVAGVPAKIIRYRYSPEQIEALNKICWWDWPDEKIREYYEDFYLPVDEFIQKHLNEQ